MVLARKKLTLTAELAGAVAVLMTLATDRELLEELAAADSEDVDSSDARDDVSEAAMVVSVLPTVVVTKSEVAETNSTF